MTNTWTDAKYLYLVNAIVRCGQYRFCFFEYAKIDDPFVPEDWALLDFFMAHVEFRDWPQSQQPVTATNAYKTAPSHHNLWLAR
ncbi:MAG: hypothetical protein R2867_25420 [Caldilineaceae bacterium]